MDARLRTEILEGFIEEARGYLPRILASVRGRIGGDLEREPPEEAYRLLHGIRGAAATVGLACLAEIVLLPEELLEGVLEGRQELDRQASELVHYSLETIETCLDQVAAGHVDERGLLLAVLEPFRRYWGLPQAEDEVEADRLLRRCSAAEQERASSAPALEEAGDRVDEELWETFAEEAEEHLREISSAVEGLGQAAELDAGLLASLRRSVHTLKGSAGLVGLTAVSRLAHRLEDLLDALSDGRLGLDLDVVALLQDFYLWLEDLISAGGGDGAGLSETDLADLYTRHEALLSTGFSAPEQPAPPPAGPPEQALGYGGEPGYGEDELSSFEELSPVGPPAPAAAAPPANPGTARPARAVGPGSSLRVPLQRVDELVRMVGELLVTRATFQESFGSLLQHVEELGLSGDRLRRLAQQLEAEYELSGLRRGARPRDRVAHHPVAGTPSGDLELDQYTELHRISRQLAETAADVGALDAQLGLTSSYFDQALDGLGRLTGEIQDRLLQLRMVPLARLEIRLRRAVRRTAQDQGKRAELIVEGGDIELDKSVLDEMADPLLHLVRNAVDHGIEPPAQRRRLGKGEVGRLRLRAYHAGPEVVLELSDDGRGLDETALRQTAVARGLLSTSEATTAHGRQLSSLVFVPGFSTAREVNEISGRGVGLDVVKATVTRLKGVVTLDSTDGQGVTFTIRLPMTLALTRALLVNAGQEVYAVPLAGIRQILRLEDMAWETAGEEAALDLGDRVVPAVWLAKAMGLTVPAERPHERQTVLLLDLGPRELALVVDQILGERELVVKSLGKHLRQVPGIAGATMLGDGSVVLILNPVDLLASEKPAPAPAFQPVARPATAADPGEVLIVDDSLSVRRALARIVADAGWKPVLARDGLEALQLVQGAATRPQVILLDIEMPRMDGYQLTATLRAQDRHRQIPIIILTSRAGERHRQKAFELGADDYLVKPFQDHLLIDRIARVTSEPRRASA